MLRISETELSGDATLLRLEGQLIGQWVSEFQIACERLLTDGRKLTLDLAEVSFVERNAMPLFVYLASHRVSFVNYSPFLAEQLKGIIQ